MTNPVTLEDQIRNRHRWINALRTTEIKQFMPGPNESPTLITKDGRCCAVGLGMKALGLEPRRAPYGDLEDMTGVSGGRIWHLNDTKRMTFAEIADWIEENYPNA